MELIKEGLTFDDVLIEPKYSEILPAETNLSYAYAKRVMAVHINAYNKQHNTKYNYLC